MQISKKSVFFCYCAICVWFLQHRTNLGKTGWKRRSRRFWICMTHRGGELFSQRYGLSKLGDIDFKYSVILEYFVQFSSSPPRSTRTLWNEYQIKTTNISTQDKNFRPQKCSSAENLKNGQIIILSSFPRTSQKIEWKINFWQ